MGWSKTSGNMPKAESIVSNTVKMTQGINLKVIHTEPITFS